MNARNFSRAARNGLSQHVPHARGNAERKRGDGDGEHRASPPPMTASRRRRSGKRTAHTPRGARRELGVIRWRRPAAGLRAVKTLRRRSHVRRARRRRREARRARLPGLPAATGGFLFFSLAPSNHVTPRATTAARAHLPAMPPCAPACEGLQRCSVARPDYPRAPTACGPAALATLHRPRSDGRSGVDAADGSLDEALARDGHKATELASDRQEIVVSSPPASMVQRAPAASSAERASLTRTLRLRTIDVLDDGVPISCRRRSLGANGGSSGSRPPRSPHSPLCSWAAEPQREVQTEIRSCVDQPEPRVIPRAAEVHDASLYNARATGSWYRLPRDVGAPVLDASPRARSVDGS